MPPPPLPQQQQQPRRSAFPAHQIPQQDQQIFMQHPPIQHMHQQQMHPHMSVQHIPHMHHPMQHMQTPPQFQQQIHPQFQPLGPPVQLHQPDLPAPAHYAPPAQLSQLAPSAQNQQNQPQQSQQSRQQQFIDSFNMPAPHAFAQNQPLAMHGVQAAAANAAPQHPSSSIQERYCASLEDRLALLEDIRRKDARSLAHAETQLAACSAYIRNLHSQIYSIGFAPISPPNIVSDILNNPPAARSSNSSSDLAEPFSQQPFMPYGNSGSAPFYQTNPNLQQAPNQMQSVPTPPAHHTLAQNAMLAPPHLLHNLNDFSQKTAHAMSRMSMSASESPLMHHGPSTTTSSVLTLDQTAAKLSTATKSGSQQPIAPSIQPHASADASARNNAASNHRQSLTNLSQPKSNSASKSASGTPSSTKPTSTGRNTVNSRTAAATALPPSLTDPSLLNDDSFSHLGLANAADLASSLAPTTDFAFKSRSSSYATPTTTKTKPPPKQDSVTIQKYGVSRTIDLSQDKLVSWTNVLRNSHPGSLSALNSHKRNVIRLATYSFLTDVIGKTNADECWIMTNQHRFEIAIPEDLVDEFYDWFGAKVDEGLMDTDPKSKSRRRSGAANGGSAPESCSSTPDGFASSLVPGNGSEIPTLEPLAHVQQRLREHYAKTARSRRASKRHSAASPNSTKIIDLSTDKDANVPTEDDDANADEDGKPSETETPLKKGSNGIMKIPDESTPSKFRFIYPSTHPHYNWFSWTEIVRTKYSNFSVRLPIWSQMVQNYIRSHELPIIRVAARLTRSSSKTAALPPKLHTAFLKWFEEVALGSKDWVFQASENPIPLPLMDGPILNKDGEALSLVEEADDEVANASLAAVDAEDSKPNFESSRQSADSASGNNVSGDQDACVDKHDDDKDADHDAKTVVEEEIMSSGTTKLGANDDEPAKSQTITTDDGNLEKNSGDEKENDAAKESRSDMSDDADPSSPGAGRSRRSHGQKRSASSIEASTDDSNKRKNSTTDADEDAPNAQQPLSKMPRTDDESANQQHADALLKNSNSDRIHEIGKDASTQLSTSANPSESNQVATIETINQNADGLIELIPPQQISTISVSETSESQSASESALPFATTTTTTSSDVSLLPTNSGASQRADLVRYNHVLKSLMPGYNSTPKEKRVEMKRLVKAYLMDVMGTKFPTCIIYSTRADGESHHTYGIAHEIDSQFREWAAAHLMRLFGYSSS